MFSLRCCILMDPNSLIFLGRPSGSVVLKSGSETRSTIFAREEDVDAHETGIRDLEFLKGGDLAGFGAEMYAFKLVLDPRSVLEIWSIRRGDFGVLDREGRGGLQGLWESLGGGPRFLAGELLVGDLTLAAGEVAPLAPKAELALVEGKEAEVSEAVLRRRVLTGIRECA